MAQTVQGLKDFFDSTGTNLPVTNQQLTEVDDWLTSHTGIENPTPDDLVDFVFNMLREQVVSNKRGGTTPVWGCTSRNAGSRRRRVPGRPGCCAACTSI